MTRAWLCAPALALLACSSKPKSSAPEPPPADASAVAGASDAAEPVAGPDAARVKSASTTPDVSKLARWVLRRQCQDFEPVAQSALDVGMQLTAYRVEHVGEHGATLDLVNEALARLHRCHLFRTPQIGDFPPHPGPPGNAGRDDPTR